jgi:predicted nucleic acid-binding Zn ribbon protein
MTFANDDVRQLSDIICQILQDASHALVDSKAALEASQLQIDQMRELLKRRRRSDQRLLILFGTSLAFWLLTWMFMVLVVLPG